MALKLLSRLGYAMAVAIKPSRTDLFAALVDASSANVMAKARDCVLLSSSGRKILRDKKYITSELINGRRFAPGTLGEKYIAHLSENDISPDCRSPTKECAFKDADIRYLVDRYRQVHDFAHIICGRGISVFDEVALKVFEASQFKSPLSAFAACALTFRCSPSLWLGASSIMLHSWAIGRETIFILNIPFEEKLDAPLSSIAK